MAEQSILDGASKCGICLSIYTEPRLLKCYHAFCTPCLEQLYEKGEGKCITCPLCRTEDNLQHGGVRGLRKYPYMFLTQKESEGSTLCQLCFVENIAEVRCLDCDNILCQQCGDYHVQLKTSRNHKIERLKLIKNGSQIDADIKPLDNECGQHKKELISFCKPCNHFICCDCEEISHSQHDVRLIDTEAQINRDRLLAGISALRSRIPVIENTIESVKTEQSKYIKHGNQTKREIKAHSEALKEVFCRTIDVLASKGIVFMDRKKKEDMKKMEIYIDELETEKMSMASLNRTAEVIVKHSTNVQILDEFPKIGEQLNKSLQTADNKAMPPLNICRYKSGECSEENITNLFGEIICEEGSETIKPSFRSLPIDELRHVGEPCKIKTFKKNDTIDGIIPSYNDNAWILCGDEIYLHNINKTVKTSYTVPEYESNLKALKRSGDDIWFWTGQNAVQGNSDDEKVGFEVPFENGIAGCFNCNGDLIVYNPEDSSLSEVAENTGFKRKIDNEKLRSSLTSDVHVQIVETKNLNLAILQKCHVIVLNQNGDIINIFEDTDANFMGICTDNYGSIFVADNNSPESVVMLSEDGIFQRTLPIRENISSPSFSHLAIDGCGNLWVCEDDTDITIYSYL